jgi:two-component system, NarL family, response regulator NreC
MNIILVDDHQMMRDGLRALLSKEDNLKVVGEASDGRAAVELGLKLKPEIMVMDIGLPSLNGIEATRQLLAADAHLKVVALSMNTDRRYVHAMFDAGAWSFVVKSSAFDELVRAIRAAGRGERYVSPAIASAVLDRFVHPSPRPSSELSPREGDVLRLLADGLTSKEIASNLEVAVSTVETHRKQIMSSLE